MSRVFIIGGLRTPICKTGGNLKSFLPEKLTAHLMNKLVQKYNIKKDIFDELILGNSVGPGGNLARLSLLEAGWPMNIPAVTIDFQCGSGLKAIEMAASSIKADERDLVIAGGTESTSLEPRKQYNPKDYRFKGENVFCKRAQFSPLSIGDPDMIEGAENAALKYYISREEMDKWAVLSHERALKSKNEKGLENIISPLKDDEKIICEDESIRQRVSLKLMERARPVLNPEGRITSGNACLTHDGAALIILASEEAVKKYGLIPEAEWLGSASVGIDPKVSPLGPIEAVKKLLELKNIFINDIDSIEINEAFAVKIITFLREFNFSVDRINPLGGALAYGHPYGASGAIIMLHLIEGLKKCKGKKGIATLGIAGGLGIAALIERCAE